MTDTLKNVSICTVDDIGLSITGEDAAPIVTALNEYLSRFAKPVKRDGDGNMLFAAYVCLNCQRPLGGALGTFQWGLVHGEGECANCGWPARALHYPKDDSGAIFNRGLEMILQYHPSKVTYEKDNK